MLRDQHNRCAIRLTDFSTMVNMHMHTDHCHVSGKVRAILCRYCNLALGALKEDLTIVAALAAYIKRFKPLAVAASVGE